MRNRITGRKVAAVYSDCPDPTHNGNPFIMALHPSLDEEKAASLMRRLPKFPKAIRGEDDSFRAEVLMKVLDYIEPLPPLLELEQKISRLLRHGYVGRNRNNAAWAKQLCEGFKDLDFERGGAEYVPSIRSNITGFNIFGVSGSGKSTAIESVLDLFDQVIEHTVFDGESFEQKQLTWLKLECPFDGSTKGMCIDFFSEVDELLGTNYSQTWASERKSANQMLKPMARVAYMHGLGVLVVDEIQRLSLMKSGGADKMLNFFVQLTNRIGIPVVLIGTFKSLSLFRQSFSQARRSAGQGDMIWTNMANDEDWDFLLEGLWEYQVTKSATKLDPEQTRELYDAMYEESQGIIDIAVKLYMLVQWEVIGEESEKITPSLIRSVAKKRLATLRPLLQALKVGDLDAIAKHEGLKDVVPDRDAMTEHLKRSQRRVYLGKTQRTMRNQRENAQKEAGVDALLEMISDVVEKAGYEPTLALDASKKALERHAHEQNIKLATRDALRIAEACEAEKEAKSAQKGPKGKIKKRETSLSGDLREIVKGSKKEKSPHQGLVDAGLIQSPEEVVSGSEGL